jgi:LL-diaminopimelate aminotransferase
MGTFRSSRLDSLGSAIFAELAGWIREAEQRGLDIINLGIGSPDQPPGRHVIEALGQAVSDPRMYGYPSSAGSVEFRRTAARWMMHRFGVELDPEREVLTLMGSQDGLAHLALAVTEPGDLALLPDPGYPIYAAGLALAGVQPYVLPLREENGFLPRLEDVPREAADKAKLLLLNYPSNPLSAVADLDFFERALAFARRHNLLFVHDLAYSEMAFDGFRPPSVLQIPGAKDVAVEFHSLSKSFNMAGCRIAFVVGNPDAVGALRDLKANIDYGVFEAVQQAGIAALEEDMRGGSPSVASLYERRRDVMAESLAANGWPVEKPKATMFMWAKIPPGWTSRQISREICLNTGVVVVPGDAFGSEGEGYVRIALVQEESRLREAAERIGNFLRRRL